MQLLIPGISREYVEELILSNPGYPSLYSVLDTFEILGIDYEFFKMERRYLPKSAFLFQPVNNTIMFVPEKKSPEGKHRNVPEREGFVIRIIPGQSVDDLQNELFISNATFYRRLKLAGLFIIFLGLLKIIASQFSVAGISILISCLAGLFFSFIALKIESGTNGALTKHFCAAGQKSNCDRIIRSEYPFSIPALAFSYFASQLVLMFYASSFSAQSIFSFLLPGCLLSIPVIFISAGYQYFKVRDWCRVCLLILLTLIIQAIVIGTQIKTSIQLQIDLLNTGSLFNAFIIFTTVACFTLLIKKIMTENEELKEIKISSNRIRFDPAIFKHYLLREKPVTLAAGLPDVELMMENASLTFTIVLSLTCHSCKNSFQTISKLITKAKGTINLKIIFIKQEDGSAAEENTLYIINLLNEVIQLKNSPELALKTLNDWYAMRNPKKFRHLYPLKKFRSGNRSSFSGWITENNIHSVPALFINEYKMPENYRIDELKYFAPESLLKIFDPEPVQSSVENISA